MSRLLSLGIFLTLIVWSIDALFLQAQMVAVDSTPLPNLVVKAVFIALVLVGWLGRMLFGKNSSVPRSIFRLWLLFSIYLMVETLVLILRFGYPMDYVLFSYNAYYFAILLLPIFFYLQESLNESVMTWALIISFIPLALLGIAQNLSGAPLLPTDSPNEYLKVWSWGFYGSVRAFSLFGSAANFGEFIALVGGLGVALLLHAKKRAGAPLALVLILLALTSGYCTLTRATHLEIVFVMFAVWAVWHWPRSKFVSSLPVIYGILGVLVAFVIPTLIQANSNETLLSNESLIERYVGWEKYGALWAGNDVSTFLFGTGLVQNDRFNASSQVIVDNSVLAIGLHIGFVGVLLWFAVMWSVWEYMRARCQECPSAVRIAAVAACSVWLFMSVFKVSIFYLLPFFMLLSSTAGRRKKCGLGVSVPVADKRLLAGASG